MIGAMLLSAAQVSSPPADIRGEWLNQPGTAIVRIADCPSGLCGTVVWSTASAKRDAAHGGTVELDGTTVMSGFVAKRHGWRGRLYLPDVNRTVAATITVDGTGKLRVSACELGGLVCRSQMWTRRPAN